MAEYVSPEIPQDPAAIRQQMIDDLAEDGITVRPATPTYYLLAVFAFLWAQLAEQATQVFASIFRYYGQKVVRIPQADAVAATTTVTFTARDTNGPYEIPVGTEINLRAADGTPAAFRTNAPATIPNGYTTITPVTVVAAVPGAAGNGLSVLVSGGVTQTFSWLDSVTVLAPTGGGADAETDDEFQDRLAELLSLPTRTLAHTTNFEVFARNQPGIDRALAINTYMPGPPANDDAPGHITVFPIDATGGPLTTPEKTALLAQIQQLALNNLIPHIADPTYTTVTVAFTGVASPGEDPDEVRTRAEAAVRDFLDPARWAIPSLGDLKDWEDRPIVRYQDVSTVLNNTEGFDHHTLLTINGAAGDLTLAGPAALPALNSTATGTVTAP